MTQVETDLSLGRKHFFLKFEGSKRTRNALILTRTTICILLTYLAPSKRHCSKAHSTLKTILYIDKHFSHRVLVGL